MEEIVKEKKPRAPRSTPGALLAKSLNTLPLGEFQAFVDKLDKIVAEQLKALLSQPRKP